MQCPKCGSSYVVKNGSIANGKKKFLCKECSRQFVEHPQNRQISDAEWRIVDRLLLEKNSIAGIARAVSISKRWLQEYIKKKRDEVRRKAFCMSKAGKIFIEADEMWTFVGSKENDIWIWLASERRTKLIVGAHVGKRDDAGAAALWKSLSEDCKKNGIFFTDGLASYGKVFPAERHSVVSKGSGKTSHIERINLTFRQRVSALVRKTLSFSRSIENLTASVWRFINHYNDCILFH
ncbi:IS1 transposase [Candidatus Electronema aureum]